MTAPILFPGGGTSGPLEIARAAWGDGLPEWVEALAVECAGSSQNKVAARMNRSAALISQVLRAKYAGSLTAVEEVFRGVFQQARVSCPALGLMPANECQDWRRKGRTFHPGNPTRVKMFRACAHCPRNRPAADDASRPEVQGA